MGISYKNYKRTYISIGFTGHTDIEKESTPVFDAAIGARYYIGKTLAILLESGTENVLDFGLTLRL
jgi:hypothetical protein